MIILISFIVALAVVPCWAVKPYEPVHPDPLLEPWRWRTFSELKGLGLQCMTEDRDGNMWFGTDEGVRRYDGINWKVYTLEEMSIRTPVRALWPHRDGSVYAGTEQGIYHFSGETWTRVFPPEGDLPWHINDLMSASDGHVWAGTPWGALRIGSNGPTLYTTAEVETALRTLAPYVRFSTVPDKAVPDRPWSRSRGEGIGVGVSAERRFVARSGGIPLVIWTLASGGPGELAGLKVGDRILQVDGNLPLFRQVLGPAGTSVRLAIQREGVAEPFEITVRREQVEGSYREFPVWEILEDREGAIWFGLSRFLQGGEIVRYDIHRPRSDDAWQLYTEKDSLIIGYRPRITQTSDGDMWMVSDSSYGGVNRFDGKTWTSFRPRDTGGSDLNPSILKTKDGTLWVGGFGLLNVNRKDVWSNYKSSEVSIPSKRIVDLLEAYDGAVWIAGLRQEVVRLDHGTARWMTYEHLLFQCETPDGSQWFLHKGPDDWSGRGTHVIRFDGRTWTRYGVEDGLMVAPSALVTTQEGVLWAAGSHINDGETWLTAATARFNGTKWSLATHPRLAGGIEPKAILESADGAIWFGGQRGTNFNRGQQGGVLRFEDGVWTHFVPPDAPTAPYAIGQTADGVLWFGGGGLRRFDGKTWTNIAEPKELTMNIHDIRGEGEGLWVGTRADGVYHFDGQKWRQYDVRDGLAGNSIQTILPTKDGNVWVVTDAGISRFDGQVWLTRALPFEVRVKGNYYSKLRKSQNGEIWINDPLRESWRTARYTPDGEAPETQITLFLDEVSQPGNTTLAWKGADPWKATPDDDLQYAHRLDGKAWSPFSQKTSDIFLSLPSGKHIFEVKARDRDFNEDPTPASVMFTVVSPVWQQPWFVAMVVVFLGMIGFQTGRVVRRDRRLRAANTAMSDANKELFGVNKSLLQNAEDLDAANQELRQDRAVERIRGEVQAMEKA
jgi:hypothetical protein